MTRAGPNEPRETRIRRVRRKRIPARIRKLQEKAISFLDADGDKFSPHERITGVILPARARTHLSSYFVILLDIIRWEENLIFALLQIYVIATHLSPSLISAICIYIVSYITLHILIDNVIFTCIFIYKVFFRNHYYF